MKRKQLFTIILCLATILPIVSGCKTAEKDPPQETPSTVSAAKDTQPLRVFIDVEYGSSRYVEVKNELSNYLANPDGEKSTLSFNTRIKDLGGPSSIKFEFPPVQGSDRELYLTR